MTNAEAAHILRRFNTWRRGEDDPNFMAEVQVGEIGQAIDQAIAVMDAVVGLSRATPGGSLGIDRAAEDRN